MFGEVDGITLMRVKHDTFGDVIIYCADSNNSFAQWLEQWGVGPKPGPTLSQDLEVQLDQYMQEGDLPLNSW